MALVSRNSSEPSHCVGLVWLRPTSPESGALSAPWPLTSADNPLCADILRCRAGCKGSASARSCLLSTFVRGEYPLNSVWLRSHQLSRSRLIATLLIDTECLPFVQETSL